MKSIDVKPSIYIDFTKENNVKEYQNIKTLYTLTLLKKIMSKNIKI